ncbi:hypothetical protein HK101_010627 [Irineochytrium annulatum]|nr:hypothetical protein HK101_010627 [Irineochytrium annulatum]
MLSEDKKKSNHIASEQRRRQNIREGFHQLVEIVPTLTNCQKSEAVILQKSVEYIQQLSAPQSCGNSNNTSSIILITSKLFPTRSSRRCTRRRYRRHTISISITRVISNNIMCRPRRQQQRPRLCTFTTRSTTRIHITRAPGSRPYMCHIM